MCQVSDVTLTERNGLSLHQQVKSRHVCNIVESYCLHSMGIVYHHADGRFKWLIPWHQSVNPSREATSILSGKYKRFMLAHPVGGNMNEGNSIWCWLTCGL